MSEGQLVLTKHRNRELGTVVLKSVDEDLAARLPRLRLPPMPDQARAAFRAILAYEAPPANGSLVDFLQLAENRGYSAHPCDWIPDYDWKLAGRHPDLYQPWVDWLSEAGFTKFHSGNRITPENFTRFSPMQRQDPIKALIRKGRTDDFTEIKAIADAHPASVRVVLAGMVEAWGSFSGCYPWQVPLLEYFLMDKSDKVRATARRKLDKMGEFTTEFAHARTLAAHIMVQSQIVRWTLPPEPHTTPFYKEFASTSFAAIADALGLSPTELAQRVDLDGLGKNLMVVAALTGDVDVRTILVTRWLDHGVAEFSLRLFDDVPAPLWKRGLRAVLRSEYMNSVGEYLGAKSGSLDHPELDEWLAYERMPLSVTDELTKRKLPINKSHDPLRVMGKIVSKSAARQLLDEALRLGMTPENPRLTMLKFNLAL